MTINPKPRARRKKAAPAFYTPVDDWQFTPHAVTRMTIAGVAENERAYGRLSYKVRQELIYWEAHRGQMI